MYAMNCPRFTCTPSTMPGANRHCAGFAPSSVPGVSLLMWMYQYFHPSVPVRMSMLPECPLESSRANVIVPSFAASSWSSLVPMRSLPGCWRAPPKSSK